MTTPPIEAAPDDAPWPTIPRELVAKMKGIWPNRCRAIGEPVDQHERYAGSVYAWQLLEMIYRSQNGDMEIDFAAGGGTEKHKDF